MSEQVIRVFGDPVLRQTAKQVDDIDGKIAKLVEGMFQTMYEAPGIGLAATQVGVEKRLFVYDLQDGEDPQVVINPEIIESSGEWSYEEGCLSVPGLRFDIVRPKQVLLRGLDMLGNTIEVEADELLARLYQHEVDHLNGTLLIERLDDTQRKQALAELRKMGLGPGAL